MFLASLTHYCSIAVFFAANRIFELNLGTIVALIALLSMWAVGYHEQGKDFSTTRLRHRLALSEFRSNG